MGCRWEIGNVGKELKCWRAGFVLSRSRVRFLQPAPQKASNNQLFSLTRGKDIPSKNDLG
jgi:hypothetical protein